MTPRAAIAALLAMLSTAAEPLLAQSILTVDSTVDMPDSSPGDGLCASAEGACTLRAAMMEAGSLPGATGEIIVRVPPGTYALSNMQGDTDFRAESGDLDAVPPAGAQALVVAGWHAGAEATAANRPVITAAPGFPRRLLIAGPRFGQEVRLQDLVLQGARPVPPAGQPNADNGGAIRCVSNQGGRLTLVRSALRDNRGRGVGAALFAEGCDIELRETTVASNCGLSSALHFSQAPVATVRKVTLDRVAVLDNDAQCLGTPVSQFHAMVVTSASATESVKVLVENSTFSGNTGLLLVNAVAGAPTMLRSIDLRHVTGYLNAPSFLGSDGLMVYGDVNVRVSHSTLGDLPGEAEGARVTSLGHSRMAMATIGGGTYSPHGTDVSQGTPVKLAGRAATGDYTEGYEPLAGSPLLDTGASIADDDDLSSCASGDQRGKVRPFGAACEIGALEVELVEIFHDGFE